MDDINNTLTELANIAKDMRHEDFSKNINETIPYIKDLVNTFLREHKNDIDFNLTNLLTPEQYDMGWIIAQGESIIQCVEYFLKTFADNLEKAEKLKGFTTTFIFDFIDLNSWLIDLKLPCFYDPKVENSELTYISGKDKVMSLGAFQASQKSCGIIAHDSPMGQSYKIELSPFFIRHAIELKIKNEMIGVRSVFIKKGDNYKEVIIYISKYIDFVRDNLDIFDLPSSVDIEKIRIVNKWSNDFIHTGAREYFWQLQSAVLTIEPLFECENSLVDNFRHKSVTKEAINEKLQKTFGDDKIFNLRDN